MARGSGTTATGPASMARASTEWCLEIATSVWTVRFVEENAFSELPNHQVVTLFVSEPSRKVLVVT